MVADRATPHDWYCEAVDFLSVSRQREMFPEFDGLIPFDHYCRKNLGYLYAILNGATCILETDDDNVPYSHFGADLRIVARGRRLEARNWVNIYKHFHDGLVWPRGLPLDKIHEAGEITGEVERDCPIQQFLVDRDPDVDAIWRLLNKEEIFFQERESVVLEPGTWSPFNSQNTLFFPIAFPLLYLPCHVSFRATDIWRSLVAQCALWSKGYAIAFHSATVEQVRNPHDLLKDLELESVGYYANSRIAAVLSAELPYLMAQRQSLSESALRLWSLLVEIGIVPDVELQALRAWFQWFDRNALRLEGEEV